jgi:hypothetical protein
MKDVTQDSWARMAEFHNVLVEWVDACDLTSVEVLFILDTFSLRLKHLIEAKKIHGGNLEKDSL